MCRTEGPRQTEASVVTLCGLLEGPLSPDSRASVTQRRPGQVWSSVVSSLLRRAQRESKITARRILLFGLKGVFPKSDILLLFQPC